MTIYGAGTIIANFVKATISVSNPTGGESWSIGTAQTIRWTSENVPSTVKLSLLKGGTLYSKISGAIENNGSYTWTIPSYIAAGTDYKIVITATDRGDINGSSANNFSLAATTPTALDIKSPDGGETWQLEAHRQLPGIPTSSPDI